MVVTDFLQYGEKFELLKILATWGRQYGPRLLCLFWFRYGLLKNWSLQILKAQYTEATIQCCLLTQMNIELVNRSPWIYNNTLNSPLWVFCLRLLCPGTSCAMLNIDWTALSAACSHGWWPWCEWIVCIRVVRCASLYYIRQLTIHRVESCRRRGGIRHRMFGMKMTVMLQILFKKEADLMLETLFTKAIIDKCNYFLNCNIRRSEF